MRTSRIAAGVGALALAASISAITIAGAPASAGNSCWADVTTGETLCVPAGQDLLAAVAAKGIQLVFEDDAVVAGREVAAGFGPSSAAAQTVVSIIYDDINYGGGSFVMSQSSTTSCAGWTFTYADLTTIGWNDRASSFRSYAGCSTTLWDNAGFGGTQIGPSGNLSSLGSMNDRGSSWRAAG